MRHAFFVVFLLAFSVVATAQTSGTIGMWSTYVVDNGDEPYDRPIMWMSVNQNLGGGYSVGLWGSAGRIGGREIDFLAGWAGKSFSVNVGYFIHAGGGSANLVQIDVRGARKVGKGSELYGMVSSILPTNTSGDSGVLARVGVNHSMKLGKLELAPSGWVMYDTGIYKSEDGFTLRGQLGMPIRRDLVTFTPVIRLSMPINMEVRNTRVIAGMNARF